MNEQVPEPRVVVRGEVPDDLVRYAAEKAADVAAAAPVPVLDLVVRLEHHADPARERPDHVEVSLDLDGRPVRAHRSAPTMTEAVDRAVDRLRRAVETRAERPQSLQLRHRDATSWHHGDRAARRAEHFPRPADDREIVRRKTFALRPESLEDAIFDLAVLDHDFFLFVHDETGEDNVVCRDGGAYTLLQPTPTPDAIARVGVPIRSGPAPVEMKLDDAVSLLDESDQPFVFALDPETGRGRVVYRRYDGHYGVVTPA